MLNEEKKVMCVDVSVEMDFRERKKYPELSRRVTSWMDFQILKVAKLEIPFRSLLKLLHIQLQPKWMMFDDGQKRRMSL